MQRYGSGFDKIVDAYVGYDEELQPKAYSNGDWFVLTLKDVTFKKDSVFDNSEVVNIEKEINLKGNQKIVYQAIKKNPNMNRPQISSLTGLKITSVQRAIRDLIEKGLIEFVGNSKKTGGYIIIKN